MTDEYDVLDLDEIDKRLGTVIDGAEGLIADSKAGREVSDERFEKVIGDAEALEKLLPEDEDE